MRGRKGADATLIAALAGGATVAAAAKVAGVAQATVYRRLNEESFRKAIDDARAEMVSQTVSRLSAASASAIDTLQALLGSASDFARLGAARAILEIGMRYREHEDLAKRVAQLERTASLADYEDGGHG